jgi:hypothetical protein
MRKGTLPPEGENESSETARRLYAYMKDGQARDRMAERVKMSKYYS